MNSTPVKARKTFALTIWSMMDDAVITTETFTLTVTRFADGTARCERDGVEISEQEACGYAAKAQWSGRMVLVSELQPQAETPAAEGIGKKEGHALHLLFVRLGYKDGHFAWASSFLGFTVRSFAALSTAEARRIRTILARRHGLEAA